MALGYAEPLRHAQLDEVTARAGNGALLRIYSGTRPATGGGATTLLAELVCGTPFAPGAAGGVLTLEAIAGEEDAPNGGTATWFRIVQSNGTTHVMDGDVGAETSGADMELDNTTIVAGGTVDITSFTITAGNP